MALQNIQNGDQLRYDHDNEVTLIPGVFSLATFRRGLLSCSTVALSFECVFGGVLSRGTGAGEEESRASSIMIIKSIVCLL